VGLLGILSALDSARAARAAGGSHYVGASYG
jgi:hypothetical protein